jgi:hypothetical protein
MANTQIAIRLNTTFTLGIKKFALAKQIMTNIRNIINVGYGFSSIRFIFTMNNPPAT